MLNKLKTLLGITDTARDTLLQAILDETALRLSHRYLSGMSVPQDLEYVVVAVSVVRYNRIGSEGMTSQTVEGESLSFTDNDFAQYEKDIAGFLASQSDIDSGVGVVRFL